MFLLEIFQMVQKIKIEKWPLSSLGPLPKGTIAFLLYILTEKKKSVFVSVFIHLYLYILSKPFYLTNHIRHIWSNSFVFAKKIF